jgi:glutamate N-acetyltransferase/amino-acid N-acetyltransferase
MSGAAGADHPVVKSPRESRFLLFPEGVRLVDSSSGCPTVTYPQGFLATGLSVGLKESGRPDMGVLAVAPQWREQTVSAALFTTNAYAAAPVVVTRDEADLEHLVAVVMNSGNANACTGEQGLSVARLMRSVCAETLGVPALRVAVGSTGIIGVPLEEGVVRSGARRVAEAVEAAGGPAFAQAIMTTDRFPKLGAMELDTGAGSVRLGVCAKGAGMINPALATMLCVVTTDARLSAAQARSCLEHAVGRSFNRVTVDGEMSTNDTVLFFANGASGVSLGPEGLNRFQAALDSLLLRMALMMVADGEGATKVIKVEVAGAEDQLQAERVARAVAGSPLVKTAMHGGDPNWGRVVGAAGAAMAGRTLPASSLRLGGVLVFAQGAARPLTAKERAELVAAMKQPEIEIALDLGLGTATAAVFFSDLGHEYITINAEYHT